MVAEARQLSTKTGNTGSDRIILGEFLNYCPVIAINGATMATYNVDNLLQQLKKAYTERVVRNGFDDKHLYNDNLLKLDELDLAKFEELKKIIGTTKQTEKVDKIDINKQGFTDEEYEELQRIEKKPKKERTPEEIEFLEEKKKKRDNAQKAMSILRGISIRIPLLIYGAEVPLDKDITVDNFTEIIDDASWEEFMPAGVTKDKYKDFAKYYEQDVFVAAGRHIRNQALAADELAPTERVKRLSEIFAQFKNPDKETVLTPWRVVNLHLSTTLGGYRFYDEHFESLLSEPVYVEHGEITNKTLSNPQAKILEINSKTGLYPLYVVYSIFRAKIDNLPINKMNDCTVWDIWKETVEDNLFVICKTPMAKSITKRTLLGYKKGKINAHAFDDLIMQLKEKPEQFKDKVLRGSFWNKECREMKFDAVVGNPPYQKTIKEATDGNNNNTVDIYPLFQDIALKLGVRSCLIYPAKDFQRGAKNILDKHLVRLRIYNGSSRQTEKHIPNEDSVFGTAVRRIPGDVGVVLYDNSISSDKIIYQDIEIERTDKVLPVITGFISMALKLSNYADSFRFSDVRKVCESNFVQYNPKSVLNAEVDRKSLAPIGYTKVLTNDKAGSGGKAKWFYILTKDLDRAPSNNYKVIITSAYPNESFNNSNNIEVLDRDEAFGRTKLAIYDSDDKNRALCCKKYLSTDFAKGIVLMTPYKFLYYLPDFDTIYDDIDWTKSIEDIDHQLYKKYGFTDDEIKFMESMINPVE